MFGVIYFYFFPILKLVYRGKIIFCDGVLGGLDWKFNDEGDRRRK